MGENIRIYHECEGRIEKSVPRIAVWHHKACPVMTNGDPEGQIFLSYPHTNNGLVFLLTTVFMPPPFIKGGGHIASPLYVRTSRTYETGDIF